MGIIPGRMGARSYIVRGKGNPESFMSCSHGAGRANTPQSHECERCEPLQQELKRSRSEGHRQTVSLAQDRFEERHTERTKRENSNHDGQIHGRRYTEFVCRPVGARSH
jgi:RNA-splicing ligase RtcB